MKIKKTKKGNDLMAGTDGFFKALRRKVYENLYLVIAFAVPIFIMLFAYALFKVYPFGENSVLSLDLNAQYVYYFDYIHDVLGKGESLVYSWSRNLSGEFIGIIGYYIASPFNILVWLFPRTMITEGLLTMMLAKFGACGAAFALYIHRSKGVKKHSAVIFSAMYALCAYMVVQTMDPMWLDGVIALPLICYGIESLVREYRFRLLVGSLIYAFVSNFYIGFMLAIFTVLYYICYYFAAADHTKVGRCFAGFVKKGAFTGLCGITAAMSSCFLLLPVYNSLQNGKFSFSTPDYSPATNFDLLDIARKLFPNSYDTVRMEGLAALYCGSLVLILAALYFTCKKVRFSEKLSMGLLLGIMFICMYIRPVDMLWHGGQMPNWLPYRYSFIISFLLVTFAAQAFEKIKSVKPSSIGIVSVLYIGLIILIESRDTVIPGLDQGGREVFDGLTVALPAIGFIVLSGALIYASRRTKAKPKSAAVVSVFLAALVCGETLYNAITTLNKMDNDIVFSSRGSYLDVIPPLREKVEEIKAADDGFYRIEKNFFRTVNDPMAVNMYGLSHSSSVLNARAIDMLGYFGFTSCGHYSRFSGNTPLTCDLFGVKYILNTKTNSTSDIKDKDSITYELNEDALPIAYLADDDVCNIELINGSPFANQTKLLTALLGRDVSPLCFRRFYADEGPLAENCTMGSFEGGHMGFTNKTGEASVSYYLTTAYEGEVYMYLPSDFPREAYVYVNNDYNSVCFESDNHNIKDLGYFGAGEEIHVKLILNRDDLYFKEPYFVSFNKEEAEAAVAALHEMNKDTVVEKISGTDIKATVNAENDEAALFTTIPAEKGWEIFVDGVKTSYVAAVNEALITVPLTKGSHTVELIFTPAGGVSGIVLSIMGISVYIIMILIYLLLKKPVKLSLAGKAAVTAEKTAEDTEADEAVEDTAEETAEDTPDEAAYAENEETEEKDLTERSENNENVEENSGDDINT